MLYRDPKCVFVANDFGQADVVAAWLQGQGIDAEVMNQATMGGFLSPLLVRSATGVEVWVVDSAQAADAIRLLADQEMALIANKTLKEQTGPPLVVVCEECGKTQHFSGPRERGTVQNCTHCAAYLDVETADEGEDFSERSDLEEIEGEGRRQDSITDKGPDGLMLP